MTLFGVRLQLAGEFKIEVDADLEADAHQRAIAVLERVLDGGNIDYQFGPPVLNQVREIDPAEYGDVVSFTDTEALAAIRARIAGVFDDPELLKLGALHVDPLEDVRRILEIAGGPTPPSPDSNYEGPSL